MSKKHPSNVEITIDPKMRPVKAWFNFDEYAAYAQESHAGYGLFSAVGFPFQGDKRSVVYQDNGHCYTVVTQIRQIYPDLRLTQARVMCHDGSNVFQVVLHQGNAGQWQFKFTGDEKIHPLPNHLIGDEARIQAMIEKACRLYVPKLGVINVNRTTKGRI